MPIDPRISLGVQPIQIADPIARYGQLATIQNAQNQNALAQYQLSTAQREQESVNALNEAYAKSYDPATGKINRNLLRETLARGGFGSKLPGIEKTLTELDKEALLLEKTQGEVNLQPVALAKNKTELVDFKFKQARQFLDTIDPADSTAPERYLAWIRANHADPILGPEFKARGITPEQSIARIQQAVQQGPQFFADLLNQSKLGTEKFIELNKPVTFAQDTGTGGRVIQRPGLGGPATLVPNSDFTKGKTFADINAEKQTNLASSRLTFDRDKFAFEKANPGYTIQQKEDGSIVGVNNRTLEYFPVTLGGTAPPPTAPFVSGGAAGPSAVNRGGAVAPVAEPIIQPRGEPLKGKGTALTVDQGNATAFGMRMLESDNLLSNLEKEGTVSSGRIRGAVEGTLTSLIPYQGANLAEGAGSIMNVMPGFLGGPSSEQQQYDQAKRNFITAVLRKESGASIASSEFINEEKKYFPQAGEDDKVIKQKQRARKLAIEAMKIQAGPGSKSIVETSPSTSNTPGATSASDPLGLFPAKK